MFRFIGERMHIADLRMELKMQGFRKKRTLFAGLMKWLARYGPTMFFLEMAILVLVSLRTAPGFRRAAASVLVAVLAAATTKLIVDPLAKKFNRKRPFVAYSYTPLVCKDPHDPSFPSNHAGGALALATVLVVQFPWFSAFTATLAGAILISRVYTGLHYITDVLSGGIIGTLVALVYLWVFR